MSAPTPSPTVAFLGTGTMGAPMVRCLRAAGLPVRAWNRDRRKAEALADSGAVVAGSPAEAAEGADVVVTMLFDTDAVLDCVGAAAPAEGTVWLQMSTVGTDGAQRTVELARELGLVLVDAPVLGTRKPAEDGALVVLASGPEEARDRVAPALDAMGSRTLWLGEAGQGSRLKLVCNAWVLSVTAGVAQSVAMAEGLGLDPRSFLDAISGGATDTPYAHAKGANMLDHEYPVSFALSGARKDAALIAEALRQAGVPDRHTAAVLQTMDDAVARGTDASAVDVGAVVEGLRPRT
jgi:3-hydroxyisobutyrate dehydrogenase